MVPESQRLAFIARRDGRAAARQWAERTLEIYREAVRNPRSHTSLPAYRGTYLTAVGHGVAPPRGLDPSASSSAKQITSPIMIALAMPGHPYDHLNDLRTGAIRP